MHQCTFQLVVPMSIISAKFFRDCLSFVCLRQSTVRLTSNFPVHVPVSEDGGLLRLHEGMRGSGRANCK